MSECPGMPDDEFRPEQIPSEPAGELVIEWFMLMSSGLRSFEVMLSGKCCSEFEIGWVSNLMIRFYHGNIMIGESTRKDIPIIPDDSNDISFDAESGQAHAVEIQNMVGFKSYFDDLMPKKGDDDERDDTKRLMAALSVSPDGHQLTVSIDLANTPRMTCRLKHLSVHRNKIEVVLAITNPSPLELEFDEYCIFALRKDNETVGTLTGPFQICSGEYTCFLQGPLKQNVSGVVTLEGEKLLGNMDFTWQDYLIRLFKTEIDLDQTKGQGESGNGRESK